MTSPDFYKRSLPTSTPINSLAEDSGYFSINRPWSCRSNLKNLGTLSPVQELLPARKRDLLKKAVRFCDVTSPDVNGIIFKSDKNSNEDVDSKHKSVVRAITFDCHLNSFNNNNVSINVIQNDSLLSNSYSYTNWHEDETNFTNEQLNFSLLDETSAILSSDRSPPCKKFQEDSLSANCSSKIMSKALRFDLSNKLYDSGSSQLAKIDNVNGETSFNTNAKPIHINFIEELQMRNCAVIISKIFVYLSDKDLCNISFISQHWRNAVLNDMPANSRRKDFLCQRKLIASGPNKENRFAEVNVLSPRKKELFTDISNKLPFKVIEQPLITDLQKSRFESFIEEGGKLCDNEILFKCPMCSFPAKSVRSDSKCSCTRTSCQYVFCKKCLGPYYSSTITLHNVHKCTKFQEKKKEPKIIVCSKQSKKNLRRL